MCLITRSKSVRIEKAVSASDEFEEADGGQARSKRAKAKKLLEETEEPLKKSGDKVIQFTKAEEDLVNRKCKANTQLGMREGKASS